jgi:crossover junction endodeoxyribonuclease RusA
MSIEIRIEGKPKGQPRPRAFSRGGHAAVYDPGTAEGWKALIATAARPKLPDIPYGGPISMFVTYEMPRPKRLMRKKDPEHALPHIGKPDIDNLNKAAIDALTQIGMWRDDCQVFHINAHKQYHAKRGKPGATLTIFFHGG